MERSRARASEEAILLQETAHPNIDRSSHHEDTRATRDSESSDDWLDSAPETNGLHDAEFAGDGPAGRRKHDESRPWRQYCPFMPAMILNWLEGPQPPRPFKISPLCASFLPIWHRSPRMRQLGSLLLFISTALYCVVFISVLIISTSGCKIDGRGAPQRMSCTDQLWRGESECGVDGQDCRPFNDTSYAFKCPADCSRVQVLEPYSVGGEMINYRTLVIGGPANDSTASVAYRYRGDSFLCPAAIHAGIIPDHMGGVGIVELTGQQGAFPNVSANGIDSIGFDPEFPLSFTFREAVQSSSNLSFACKDPRWILLGLTILYNILVSLIAQSTSIFYSAVFTSAYFCISLAADAPEPTNYLKVVSLAVQGYLPASFIAYTIYRFYVKRTLTGLSGSMDQLVLWLGGFWIGALDNMTFDKLPIQRLIPHDIIQQPGAAIALLAIVLFVIVGGIGQAWAFRLEGRLLQYLILYCLIAVGITLLALVPDMNLRMHHYIIAMLLIPGTALQTRPSLVYQGLLVGLFLNGVARWGFASVLEVPEELFRTGLHPKPILEPATIAGNNVTFSWLNVTEGYNSLSILVNDVERFRGYNDAEQSFTWTRERPDESVYFRFAYTRLEAVEEITIGDYSNPGTWLPDNRWIPISPDEE